MIPIHVKQIHSLQLSWEWSIHTITVGLHRHAKLLPNFSWDVNSIRHSNVNFKILLNTYQRRLKHDYGTNLKSFYSRHSYNIYNVKSNSSSSFTPCSKGVTNNDGFIFICRFNCLTGIYLFMALIELRNSNVCKSNIRKC